jgi:hypothetical protein
MGFLQEEKSSAEDRSFAEAVGGDTVWNRGDLLG